jgi:hypothetical protein
MSDTLSVMDNSYLEIKFDIEGVAPGEDPRQWGAMCAEIYALELGEHTAILTEGVHVADGTFVQSDGLTALHVEIGPKDKQALENLPVVDKAQKVLHNGQVYILRDGKTYNALGIEIK